ncbi:DUF2711 family protein [Bacillus velezensis]|uniref:DUF2711 family protein n=1 Tax=Bacillus TaxID=1386 RepID=UPI0002AADF38|nr:MULTISPECIES: DUF2711 family protein [Bacillus]QKP73508.1 DUF2711 family protein [Bacillus amyloliquefaciens]SLB08102.1 Protein of uncharacterised function (DUF2711) [Mycobacteroides abscessus subsp. massiliense]MBL3625301.1 DUF2711 family protein [Bacillus sp. RHF6]MBL4958831.1 DUF2711 family protein [Bacillus velezensis]MCG1013495.1 DUF2711 family protein [Bacillus velezensis]
MLETLHFEEGVPILRQLPKPFTSAAFLLHPFVLMSDGWEEQKRKRPYEHIYPSDEEIIAMGRPVSWKTVMTVCGLRSEKETALALMSAVTALREEYALPESARLFNRLHPDLYLPSDDVTSPFLIPGLLDVFRSKGIKRCTYYEPVEEKGIFSLNQTAASDVCGLLRADMIIADEKRRAAFMSIYDSFTTLFLMEDQDMPTVIRAMNWEAVICSDTACINWYSQ